MKNKAITLTILANMTSNYGESIGNIACVQKIYRDGQVYAIRSRESLKNAIMVQSGMYDDLQVEVDGAAQKKADEQLNASNCRALEGGYMNTGDKGVGGKVRKSSFYLTDAVACEPFINELRFHNNLYLASTYAKNNDINLQKKSDNPAGLIPYQYEYSKSLKKYSITIDLDKVGVDENYNATADSTEKATRVKALIDAVEALALGVKGNLDNAEPLFIVGGLGRYKTHYFDNVVVLKEGILKINENLKARINTDYYRVALLDNDSIKNVADVKQVLSPISIVGFFEKLRQDVEQYYASH